MKNALWIASAVFAAALAGGALPAEALTAKECGAKYQAAKTAGTLNGQKWNDFRKAQCSADAAPAAAAPPPLLPPPAAAPATTAAKPSGGRAAMIARERACGADWKAAKAAGTIPAGQKWPQYWSECNKRKKAEGM